MAAEGALPPRADGGPVHPPLVAAFYERLVAAGKPKMAAVGACMWKLLMTAYGVLKGRTPFDPARGSRITA